MDIIADLQNLAAQLHGHLEEPRMRWEYLLMNRMFGTKVTTWARRVLPETKSFLSRTWDKAMFDLEARQMTGRNGIGFIAPKREG